VKRFLKLKIKKFYVDEKILFFLKPFIEISDKFFIAD
jgi:hypothetical protein